MPAFAPHRHGAADAPHPDLLRAESLRKPAVLAALLERFAATLPGAERTALVSLWSQFYFGRLIVPAVQLVAERARSPGLRLDAMHVAFCPRQGVPLSFHADAAARPRDPADAVGELVDGHIAPLVAILRRQTGVSERLLWANAGWSLALSIEQMDCAGAERRKTRDALIAALDRLPAGGPIGLGRDVPPRRHVCCLRYRITGYARCSGICPLRESEAADCHRRRRSDPVP